MVRKLSMAEKINDVDWKAQLAPWEQPRLGRSLLDLATSAVPYFALTVGMYATLGISIWLTLGVAVPTAGFLLRTFIVFHDCGHGSFMPSRRANRWVGRVTALLVWQPYANWRHDHAVHHGSAGDLDRRGQGDVLTLTVREYSDRSWRGRLGYRLFRNPLVMLGVGPIWSLMFGPRLGAFGKRARLRNSILLTNVGVAAMIAAICAVVGVPEFLLVQIVPAFLAAAAGVWLFYVQHQFEDVYWRGGEDWSYASAALRGSSYLKLPQPAQFFTGNIGLHHVHHLSARVPNYNLQAAHDANEVFHDVPVLSFAEGIRSLRLKLIDTESGRLVTFAEGRALVRRREATGGTPSAAPG